jgi:hypothetical protein
VSKPQSTKRLPVLDDETPALRYWATHKKNLSIDADRYGCGDYVNDTYDYPL